MDNYIITLFTKPKITNIQAKAAVSIASTFPLFQYLFVTYTRSIMPITGINCSKTCNTHFPSLISFCLFVIIIILINKTNPGNDTVKDIPNKIGGRIRAAARKNGARAIAIGNIKVKSEIPNPPKNINIELNIKNSVEGIKVYL